MDGPRKKLVERFEVLGIEFLDGPPSEPWGPDHYEGVVEGTVVRVLKLSYETHLDARLGAQGLRVGGFTVLGITDLHTSKKVDDSAPTITATGFR